MSKDLTKNLGELNDSVKRYAQTKLDLVKLNILEKTVKLSSVFFAILVIVFFLLFIVGFAGAAFAVWYGETYNNYVEGLLLTGGGFLFIAIILILLRKVIINAAILKNLSGILFEEPEQKEKSK